MDFFDFMNVEINRLTLEVVTAFEVLLHIFGDVFERDEVALPDPDYLLQILSNPAFWVVIARVDGEVIGGITAYVLPGYYTPQPTLYLYDVGVTPTFQGRGVGKQLIDFLRAECATADIPEMYVQAEAADQDAVSFYRKSMPSNEIETVQFSYLIKEAPLS